MQGVPGLAHFVALCLRGSVSTRYVVHKIREPKHTNQILRQSSQPKLVSQAHMRNLMKPSNDPTRCDVVARVMATPIPHLAEISSQNNDSPEHAVNSNPDVECIPPGEILLTQRQPHVEY